MAGPLTVEVLIEHIYNGIVRPVGTQYDVEHPDHAEFLILRHDVRRPLESAEPEADDAPANGEAPAKRARKR